MKLDLAAPRDLGSILSDTFGLFFQHAGLFLTLALIVVAPVSILVDGVWGGQFEDGLDAEPGLAPSIVSGALSALVVTPLITALHVRVVERISRGEEPTLRQAFADVRPVLLPVFAVVALYMLVVVLGFVALILPGIWLAVRFYFSAQAAVVEGRRGREALTRSGELVAGSWWRVFGILLLVGIVTGAFSALAGATLGLLGSLGDEGAGTVVGFTIGSAVGYSLGGLAGTLLFFDLKARKDLAPAAPAPHAEFLAPEAPR